MLRFTSFSTNFVESNFLFNKSSVLCAITRLLQRPGEKSGEDWPGYPAFRDRPYPLNIEITLYDPPNSQPSDRLFSATPPG
jgi:hypothetical protein